MKSALVDFLINAGLKVKSIASYNHLGNNDGMNLSSQKQFRSKEISKSNVVDDMVEANTVLYKPDEHPDHTVVIKYMPAVGDSKRALDEYYAEIFMGGKQTISYVALDLRSRRDALLTQNITGSSTSARTPSSPRR